jgi:hypothetical protein
MDPKMVEIFVRAAIEHGIPGLIIAALCVALWSKDKELTAERRARVDDANKYTGTALELQRKLLESIDKSERAVEAAIQAGKRGLR